MPFTCGHGASGNDGGYLGSFVTLPKAVPMTVIEKIIEALLPGTRSLRPPVIGGLLWGLFLWLLLADVIPLASESTGWAQQLYIMIAAVGPLTTLALAAIFIFILGASMSNVSELVSRAVGGMFSSAQRMIAWNRHATRGYYKLSNDVIQAQKELDTAQQFVNETEKKRANEQKVLEEQLDAQLHQGSGSQPSDSWILEKRSLIEARGLSSKYKSVDTLVDRMREELTSANDRLADMKSARTFGRYYRRTPELVKTLGKPPATANEGLELEVVDAARQDGRDFIMEEKGEYFPPEVFAALSSARNEDLDNAFVAELETDPLEVLRALDDPLFLEVDRLRAEREVRLSFATPILALIIFAAIQLNIWLLLLLSAIPITIMVRYSFDATEEKTKVLRLMRLHNLRTPALRRAYERGKRDMLQMIERREDEMQALENRGLPPISEDASY